MKQRKSTSQLFFQGLAGPLMVWFCVIFLLVVFVGWHQFRDITVIHDMAAKIQRSNTQSHRLHDLEVQIQTMASTAHHFLIAGSVQSEADFRRMQKKLALQLQGTHQDGINIDDITASLHQLRRIADRIFSLPYATSNMEGPILENEMDVVLKQLAISMNKRHHAMDNSVNHAMQMVSALQLDMRDDFLFSVLLLFSLLFALMLYTYRKIVHPLIRLRRGVASMRYGQLKTSFSDFDDNEIGALAQALNHMSQAIAQYTQELGEMTSLAAHQEKMNALGLLSAGLAHEVGNPLAAADVSLTVAMRKQAQGKHDEAKQYLEAAKDALERIETMINSMLDFSRPDSQIEQKHIDLAAIIDGSIKLVCLSRHGKSLTFNVDCSSRLPPLSGKPDIIKQVLVNLLINASDASEHKATVYIHVWSKDNAMYLDVQDEGSGIPKTQQTQIFSPMFTTKSRGEGTGLGLAISRNLMRRMKGDLALITSGPTGSLFRITFTCLY